MELEANREAITSTFPSISHTQTSKDLRMTAKLEEQKLWKTASARDKNVRVLVVDERWGLTLQ